MFKKIVFVVMYLNLMKSPANGFVIDVFNTDTFNQWLQPFNTMISVNLKDTPDDSSEKYEQTESNPNSLEDTSFSGTSLQPNQPPVPISRVLETIRNQIDTADNDGKKQYTEILTDLEHMFTQKSRYARIFFNHMWHVVDLGLYGSSQRKRDASAIDGMLKPLRDLLKWIYKNAVDLLTWNIATDEDFDDDDPETIERNREKHEKDHPDEGGIKVTTKVGEKGEDIHKIVHKFEIDPFIVKLNMDITCRILDDTKNPKDPNNLKTSSSHREGEIKVQQKPLKEDEDDWDYSSTREKLHPDKKVAPGSGSQKDSKPSPAPSDKGGSPIPPSTGIKACAGNTEGVPSVADKGKQPEASKVEKVDKPTPSPVPPKPTPKPDPVPQTGDPKSKKFEGNPVDRDLLNNPPPPGKPLSYSEMKRMKPPPKTPPPDDDDDDFENDWEKNWPGYRPVENNPHFKPLEPAKPKINV